MKELLKRYTFYLIRWQLSTPLLAVCVYLLTKNLGPTLTTIIANFIGGLIFFWVDQWIFKKTDILFTGELWEVKNNIVCQDCNKQTDRGYRLIRGVHYDKSRDKTPQFRCHDCSRKKYTEYKTKLEK
ncbi:MAG: hypothetical protein JXB88_16205 [Spirochaetales bacterium]|nr:hypothetical protein [Spirochaetales bacterium]